MRSIILVLAVLLAACQPAAPTAQTPGPYPGQPGLTTDVASQPTPAGGPAAQPETSIAAGTARSMPPIGVETHRLDQTRIDLFRELRVGLVRRNGLLWSAVEPVEGQRNWEAVADLERELASLGAFGMQTILVVRSTPDWAQKVPGYTCGAIKQEKLAAFALFMQDLVARYSAAPYQVKYFELGNEPDVDPAMVGPNSPFGCWGDPQDAGYGGGYYAEMLKTVYPAIKAADPQAQVLVGGLLLDCDPENPPEGKDCAPARFLEGILQAGGGNSFDIVSFHGYPFYNGSLEQDEFNPDWASRGGTVVGRIAYLRQVMAQYGVDKPLLHTESSLVCPEWYPKKCTPPEPNFLETQADYLTILFVRNWAAGVAGTVWYQFEGPAWRHVGLLDDQGAPKPAYRALLFYAQELKDALYSGPVSVSPAVRGVEFRTAEKRIWVIWSPDAQPDAVTLPEGVQQALDKYGARLAIEGGVLNVGSPVYLELAP